MACILFRYARGRRSEVSSFTGQKDSGIFHQIKEQPLLQGQEGGKGHEKLTYVFLGAKGPVRHPCGSELRGAGYVELKLKRGPGWK